MILKHLKRLKRSLWHFERLPKKNKLHLNNKKNIHINGGLNLWDLDRVHIAEFGS